MRESLRHAFTSFLATPSLVIAVFVLLSVAAYALESELPGWLQPIHAFLRSQVFGEPETTSNLLGTIATGIITITGVHHEGETSATGG